MARFSELRPLAVGCIGGALWLVWAFEHERTGIRAPWTGLTVASSAMAFVVVGYIGRGWRVFIWAVLPAAVAVLLVDPLIWKSPEAPPVAPRQGCDPSCGLSPGFMVAFAGAQAALLAAVGVVVRIAVHRTSRDDPHAASQD